MGVDREPGKRRAIRNLSEPITLALHRKQPGFSPPPAAIHRVYRGVSPDSLAT